jgi:hypothetical protein
MRMRNWKDAVNGRGYDGVEGYPLPGFDMHVGMANHIACTQ